MHIKRTRTVLGMVVMAMLLLALPASAADTGFFNANQTIVSSSVAAPNNGWTSNNLYATFNAPTDTAEYGFPDLGIPAGVTIEGIEVTIEGQRNGSPQTRDLTAALWNTSALEPDAYTAPLTATLQDTDTVQTLGGPAAKWGTTWTVADFADATFKIRAGATSGSGDADLDAIQVKVYYKFSTTTSVSCTSPVTYGSSSSCTATVTRGGGSNTPAGTVDWTLSGGDTGTFSPTSCTLSGSGASATCSVDYTPDAVGDGTHGITATYVGNTNFTSSSGNQNVTVNKADQAALAVVDPSPVVYGTTATLSTTGGSGTGAVTFDVGASTGCSVTGDTLSVTNASGTCAVTATKAGDDNYNPATSAAQAVTLQKASTTTSLTSSANPSVFGSSVTFTAAVDPSLATGTVQFYDNGVTLDIPVTLLGGTASVSTTTLAVGTHVITATYSGDTNHTESTGTLSPDQVVNAACSVVSSVDFIFAPALPKVGQPVSFTGTATGGTAPITYTWNFGDGTPPVSPAANPVHSFPLTTTVRTYSVALTAENACTSPGVEVTKQVTVAPYRIFLPLIRR